MSIPGHVKIYILINMLRLIKLSELIASGFIPSPERDRWCRVWVDLGRQAKLGKILTTQNTASQFFRPTVFYVVGSTKRGRSTEPRQTSGLAYQNRCPYQSQHHHQRHRPYRSQHHHPCQSQHHYRSRYPYQSPYQRQHLF